METPGQADNQRDLAIQANKKKVYVCMIWYWVGWGRELRKITMRICILLMSITRHFNYGFQICLKSRVYLQCIQCGIKTIVDAQKIRVNTTFEGKFWTLQKFCSWNSIDTEPNLTGDKDALYGRHPLRDLLVSLPSIQLSILAPVSPEVCDGMFTTPCFEPACWEVFVISAPIQKGWNFDGCNTLYLSGKRP